MASNLRLEVGLGCRHGRAAHQVLGGHVEKMVESWSASRAAKEQRALFLTGSDTDYFECYPLYAEKFSLHRVSHEKDSSERRAIGTKQKIIRSTPFVFCWASQSDRFS